jgi:hypothetical protein
LAYGADWNSPETNALLSVDSSGTSIPFAHSTRFNKALTKLVPTRSESENFAAVTADIFKNAEEVRNRVDEAIVYANRKTLIRMRALFVELDATLVSLAAGTGIEDADVRRKAEAVIRITNQITYELAA